MSTARHHFFLSIAAVIIIYVVWKSNSHITQPLLPTLEVSSNIHATAFKNED